MRYLFSALILIFGTISTSAFAQLEPFTDYSISDEVWSITTVKIDPNMSDYYLEGIRNTWAAANDVAKELGHIEDYSIYGSDLPQSGHFNLLLIVKYKSTADLAPSKAKYDAFMKAWGEANEKMTRKTSKNYPSMRELTGQYQMRKLEFK